MVFHTAGRLAAAGDYATLADGRRFTDLLTNTHRGWLKGTIVLHPWVYPPTMLPIAMAVGALPFGLAYAAVVTGSLLLLLVCVWRCWPAGSRRDLAIALLLLSPGTGWCIGAGQVSFAVAGIMLAGLTLLRRREFAAGLVLSLLTLKPQFAVLVPIALLAGRQRNAFIGFTLGCGDARRLQPRAARSGPLAVLDPVHHCGRPAFCRLGPDRAVFRAECRCLRPRARLLAAPSGHRPDRGVADGGLPGRLDLRHGAGRPPSRDRLHGGGRARRAPHLELRLPPACPRRSAGPHDAGRIGEPAPNESSRSSSGRAPCSILPPWSRPSVSPL